MLLGTEHKRLPTVMSNVFKVIVVVCFEKITDLVQQTVDLAGNINLINRPVSVYHHLSTKFDGGKEIQNRLDCMKSW